MTGNIDSNSYKPVEQQRQEELSKEQGVIPQQAGKAQTTNAKGGESGAAISSGESRASSSAEGAAVSSNQGVFAMDTIAQENLSTASNPNAITINGEVIFQSSPTNPGTPELSPPLTPVNVSSIQELNAFFNSAGLTTLVIALELMALSMQKQKIIDKQTELKLADLTYKMTEASAELTLQLGKLEQMEHIWKGVTILAAGFATGMAARYLPSSNMTAGANKIAFFEMFKSVSNAASEFVSAGYSVPKATLQALKQIKDQVIQLLMANKDSSAAASKELQEYFDRLAAAMGDLIQKQTRAFEV